MSQVTIPQAFIRYFTPDGQLTQEGSIYFTELAKKVIELEARIVALEP